MQDIKVHSNDCSMTHWLVKTEPAVYSIDDLRREKVTCWDHIRNYQARNFLRQMCINEEVLIYHSSTSGGVGVVGLAKVAQQAYPDPSQFDSKSEYFDGGATVEKPRWYAPDLKFVKKFSDLISLAQLKREPALAKMVLLRRGNRLSVMPVTTQEFSKIVALGSAQIVGGGEVKGGSGEPYSN